MNVTTAELEKQIANALSNLDKIGAVKLPASIKDAVDGEWLKAAEDGGIELLERVDADELAAMGRKVMTIEKANFYLVALEDALVSAFVKSADSPWRIAIRRLTMVPKFLASHAGDIDAYALPLLSSLLINAMVLGHEAALVGVQDGVNRVGDSLAKWVRDKTGLPFHSKRVDVVPEGVLSDYKSRMFEVNAAIMGVVVLAGYWSVERMLAVVRTVAAYKAKLQATFAIRAEAVELGQGAALFQARRVAFTRKKRTRR